MSTLSSKLGLSDLSPSQIQDQRVLMRVDFNVPLDKSTNSTVTDSGRIKAALPSIKYILERNPKSLILMSHLGRPDGRVVPTMSLKPVVPVLEELLGGGEKVTFVPDCVGELEKYDVYPKIVLLENLRFHIEEEGKGLDLEGNKVKASDKDIAKFRCSLSSYADVYVNDAFGTAHRAHSSMVGITTELRAAGFLMKRELDYFSKALESPKSPFLAIVGGSKVKDKILLIKNLINLKDKFSSGPGGNSDFKLSLIICGGMAYTFKKVLLSGGETNYSIGNSLFDEEGANIVQDIMALAERKNVTISLPIDHTCGDKFSNDCEIKVFTDDVDPESGTAGIPAGWMGLDAGPKTTEINKSLVKEAKTILWNGPFGVFEMSNFAKGSMAVLEEICKCTTESKGEVISIVGGGDTASLVVNAGKGNEISHVSTGGGASLELLEGSALPGVTSLSEKVLN